MLRFPRFNFKSPPSRSSPFLEPTIEMFPKGLPCKVTETIRPLELGQVQMNGVSWRAELYQLNCGWRLLEGQPAEAIGRRGTCLIVIPLHCLLWQQYLEEYSLSLKAGDVTTLDYYERHWKN